VTWADSDLERARGAANTDRGSLTRLSFARRIFPGLLAAAATAGVIVGDGWRSGSAWTTFIELGAASLAASIGSAYPSIVLAMVGLSIHAFWFVVWGLCFTAVARSLRGGKLFIAAAIVTATLWVLARAVFPFALGAAELSLMSAAHAVLYVVTIAVALTIGTRLARYA